MEKRFFDTAVGLEVQVVDPKDFVFVQAPNGVQILPRQRLEEIKADIRARDKATGVEYNGHTLEKSGDVLQMGFGRMVPVTEQYEYVKPPAPAETSAPAPDDDKAAKPKK